MFNNTPIPLKKNLIELKFTREQVIYFTQKINSLHSIHSLHATDDG